MTAGPPGAAARSEPRSAAATQRVGCEQRLTERQPGGAVVIRCGPFSGAGFCEQTGDGAGLASRLRGGGGAIQVRLSIATSFAAPCGIIVGWNSQENHLCWWRRLYGVKLWICRP